MAKNDVQSWSNTPASNTDIAGIDIAENCPPAGINDAIRTIMAQIASFVANAVFGAVSVVVSGLGRIILSSGSSTLSGYIGFQDAAGNPLGYIGQISNGGPIPYVSQNGGGHQFSGGPGSFTGNLGVGGALNVTGNISTSGQIGASSAVIGGSLSAVFAGFGSMSATGTINAGGALTGASLGVSGAVTGASATIAGQVTGQTLAVAANAYLTMIGGNPALVFDVGDYLTYDRATNKLFLYIGGNAVWSCDGVGSTRQLGVAFQSQPTV